MDIPQRTMNAVGKRDESIRRWLNSSTAKAITKTDDTHFKITFDNGSMLLSAVSSDDIDEVERLLQLGANVNFASADGLTALHQACIDENIELVELLVKAGANINARDNEGWTPLHAAASTTNLDVVDYLVKHGANISAVNTDGELAVDLTDEDDIKEFLMNEISSQKINLRIARNLEHDKMFSDIMGWISKGNVNETYDPQGASALHVAASKSYMDIMELLVERLRIDINIKDNDGWTPLHAAVYWKQLDAIAYLLKHNADYQAKTSIGLLPIDLADDDIILKYKAMLRSRNISVSYSKKSTTTDDSNVEITPEVFPHIYRPIPNPILKKIPEISGNVSRVLEKTSANNPLPPNTSIPSTTKVPIRPPIRPDNIELVSGATKATLAQSNSVVPTNTSMSTSPIKHPPRPVSDHTPTPYKPNISAMPIVETEIKDVTINQSQRQSQSKPGVPARPCVLTNGNSATKLNRPPTTTTTSAIGGSGGVHSISRPPLPTRLNTTTSNIIHPPSINLQNHHPPSIPITSINTVSSVEFKTVEEAKIEIARLKKLIESFEKDKKHLETQINNLKLSQQNNPISSDMNTEYLIQENKRLQQENTTLIKAMSTLNKSKTNNIH